mmetsp:Transcript_24260/g.32524  ORF Transcript_24260/g.32524 Transcript_24260/m.32524 type:complete len:83 (-) Transcript_24260:150-398(-)|eukprot:CAMPEP_0185598700 /NCGR_PEP_ID=MMETSP0434-20130131/82182_1 /TAXON_ID=626734 ORGANISM="Favella taraikaensis, Strain Fe Narragansett Bay" /NCGR_SAMPLE_ID=MMETSP0434 /ASSEMBLY_ACC=CAM_ASM_000379 /LENGTH=82 /DNA_ID=CAMNT_0028227795 /DNA_START=1629 /DNA_END=1877 /DNA_ORIENTATION=+
MVELVLHHSGSADGNIQGDLEENSAVARAIFRALFHMLNESLSGEENAAKFALHGDCVFENSLEDLHRIDLLGQLSVAIFNI